MRTQGLVALWLCLALVGCRWMQEQERASRRRDAETAFVETVESGDTKAVRALVEADRTRVESLRSVRERRGYRQTESALTAAVKRGRREMVDLLLALGADPNRPDGTGTLALVDVLFSAGDKPALMTALPNKSADPVKGNERGRQALPVAAQQTEDAAGPLTRSRGNGS